MSNEQPLIVVGAGVAGLSVALAAAPRQVLLLSRTQAGDDCATAFAQGGIAAALGAGDSAADHAEDTMIAGGGFNDPAAVEVLTSGAAGAIAWLQSLGVEFDGDSHGPHFAREGGHRCARVLHAGGDATGSRVLQVLQHAVRGASHVQCRTGIDVDALLLGDHGNVVGVGFQEGAGRRRINGSAVVLATGGLGGLFSATSNPASAQGAGLALGMSLGADMRDLELVQFHPTALALGATGQPTLPLLTEALRGAGAVLRDEHGVAIMRGEHPLADLAPRDIVSRRMWQMQQQGHTVFLDATRISVDWPAQFPTVLAACLAAGLDPRQQPIPVTPAAHFHMGGLATDLDGTTSIRGLYAVGEVACNGVHGGNRLASNSLLEGVVFGRRLGQLVAGQPAQARVSVSAQSIPRAESAEPAALDYLRQCLWQDLGPVREGKGLQAAQERINARPILAYSWQGRLALAMFDAAQHQRGNRGAHHRLDAEPATVVACTG